jgi:ZipA, C-terminal FtsZ-binding domain
MSTLTITSPPPPTLPVRHFSVPEMRYTRAMSLHLHRFEGEYYSQAEWPQMPEERMRVRQALGTTPLEDARHLLPPIPHPLPAPLVAGPEPTTELCVEIVGDAPVQRDTLLIALESGNWRERMGAFSIWGAMRPGWPYMRILPGARIPSQMQVLTICWPLAEMPGDSLTEMIAHIEQLRFAAQDWAALFDRTAVIQESSRDISLKAATLIGLKGRFARSLQMCLVPTNRPYAAQSVWRAAYSLGMTWGNLDLFHWNDPVQHTPLFTLSALGDEGYFLPERVAEGGSIPGLSLSFDLPTCPVPLAVYDHLAIALLYLRDTLGGKAQTPTGLDLDGEGLEESRSGLEFLVREMEYAGIAPGSPAAARLF